MGGKAEHLALRATGAIGTAEPFRHDALAAELARLTEYDLSKRPSMNISMIKLALRGFHLSGFATRSTAKKLRSDEARIGA
jgi:hypothetical protein